MADRGGGQVHRPETMTCRDQQLTGREILTHGTHVLPAGCRAGDPRTSFAVELHPLDFHHCARARRHALAGINPGELSGCEPPPAGTAAAPIMIPTYSRSGPHRDTIHGRAVKPGRRPLRPDWARCHPPGAAHYGRTLGLPQSAPAGPRARVDPLW